MKAAIYHFTDKSELRPKIYKDQLASLELFAFSKGYTEYEIFCDKSLRKGEQKEFDRLLESIENFDALITKDFYHISKHTNACLNLLQDFKNRGIQVQTVVNGTFSWAEAPFNEPLRVVTYCCRYGPQHEMHEIIPVHNDIFKHFVKNKTNWTIIDQYYDESLQKNGQQQVQLLDLLENKENFDLLLVHNYNNLHYRTVNFCRIREQLQKDIYSLQEGFLEYRKEEERKEDNT